jgi:hypothetical protein
VLCDREPLQQVPVQKAAVVKPHSPSPEPGEFGDFGEYSVHMHVLLQQHVLQSDGLLGPRTICDTARNICIDGLRWF